MGSRSVGLLVLLVGLLVAGGPARASGVRLQCVPGHVRLGTDREVEVWIELEPSATGLELFASRGEVGALTQVKPGVFRASYVPPRQKLPQEVILAALARGPQGLLEGWTVLPLWGQGEAEVRTRAGASVSIRVGERTYGPVRADATGLALIPVSVPPGVQEAFFGSKRIDLGVPPRPFVHALARRRELQADREETVDLRLYFLKAEGAPPPEAFTFSATRGTVGTPTEVGPGVFALSWTVPPGPSGALELRGSARGEPRASFQLRVQAVPGPARRFELRVDREVLVASEEARVAVEVSARDAVGNPARAGLRLESELGGGVLLTERQPGEYTGLLGVAPGFGVRETLELRLLAEGGTAPVLTRTVALRAAEPARVTVEPVYPFVMANGLSEAIWRISVVDRFGNPVREPWPEFVLAGGTTSTLLSKEPGTYELRYVPPVARVDRRSELDVRVGPASGRGVLSLVRRRPVLLASPRAGVMTSLAGGVAPSVGLRLETWPVLPLPSLGLMLDTGYLRFSRAGGERVPGFSGHDALLETTVALALRTPWEKGLQGWVAAGPAVARASRGEGPVPGEGTWVLGAQALMGAGLPLGPGLPFLEARFSWFSDPSPHAPRGALSGGGLHVGYRLELF
jgi:hypothetical protein